MPLSLPDVADLKAHANITSARHDGELPGYLAAAVEIVEGIVGPLAGGSVTEGHYGVSSETLVLRQAPVAALISVSEQSYAQAPTVYPLDNYILDPEAGIVRLAWGGRFSGNVFVSYTTGRAALPAAVHLAVLIIAAHLWETQRGTAPSPLQSESDMGYPGTAGYAIPNRAKELLAPFARGARIV